MGDRPNRIYLHVPTSKPEGGEAKGCEPYLLEWVRENELDCLLLFLTNVSDLSQLRESDKLSRVAHRIDAGSAMPGFRHKIVVSEPKFETETGPKWNKLMKNSIVSKSPRSASEQDPEHSKSWEPDPASAFLAQTKGLPQEQERQCRKDRGV